MSEPPISKYKAIAAKIEPPALHPPSNASLSVMVSPDQGFLSRQARDDPLPLGNPADGHIPEVNHAILGFHCVVPIPNQGLGKIRWPVAICLHVLVLEVRIGNQINVQLGLDSEIDCF